MDEKSTLVLDGQKDLPSVKVNGTANVAGKLVLRLSFPPATTDGVWNYTIMTCSVQCQGNFQEVVVEHDDACIVIEDAYQVKERENSLVVLVSLTRATTPTCTAAQILPSILLCAVMLLLRLTYQ